MSEYQAKLIRGTKRTP